MTFGEASIVSAGAIRASWFLADRRARYADIGIGAFPRMTMLLIVVLSGLLFARESVWSIAGIAICSVAALIDARCGMLFDPLVVAASGLTLLGACADATLPWTVLGGTTAFLMLYAVRFCSRGGLGAGDVKFGFALGTLLGTQAPLGIGASFVLGAIVSGAAIPFRRVNVKARVPFGPFLVAGTWVILAYQPTNAGFAR